MRKNNESIVHFFTWQPRKKCAHGHFYLFTLIVWSHDARINVSVGFYTRFPAGGRYLLAMKHLGIWLTIAGFLCVTIFVNAQEAVEIDLAELSPVEAAATLDGLIVAPEDTISIDFPDEEIRTIIRNVADLYQLNVIIPDSLTGRTSVRLRNVTWRQLFKTVLAPAGYYYQEDGNIITIHQVDIPMSLPEKLNLAALIALPFSITLNVFLLVRRRAKA